MKIVLPWPQVNFLDLLFPSSICLMPCMCVKEMDRERVPCIVSFLLSWPGSLAMINCASMKFYLICFSAKLNI